MFDVLVAGGGPVGLAAAIEARLAGLTVAVVEPRRGAIDKACGEGLMPGGVRHLASIGVHPRGHPLLGVAYRSPRATAEHRFESGEGLGVRRTVLHEALARRADELGVERIVGRVDELEPGVVAGSRDIAVGAVRARWLLACDGLHSRLARAAGLAERSPAGPARFGIRQHFAVEPWSPLIEVHFSREAELYVTPVARDVVGVAMLARRGTSFATALAAAPEVASRLEGAEPASERRGAGPFRQRTRARVAGRVLLVGDSSGYVDALTGEGLRVGFAQARAAVAAVAAGDPLAYEASWRAATREARVLTTRLVAWAESPARRLLVPAAARLPGLFAATVERLSR